MITHDNDNDEITEVMIGSNNDGVVVVVVCVVEQNTTFQSSVLRLNTNSSLQSKSMELFPAENSIHENLLQGDFINEKTEMVKSKARNSWAEAEKKKAVKSGVSDEVVVQLAQSNATSANSMSSSFRFRKKKASGAKTSPLAAQKRHGKRQE